MEGLQVRKTEPLHVVSFKHKGPYQNLPKAYEQFGGWLGQSKAPTAGYFREIGYDNPMMTPPEECRQEICVPLAGHVVPGDGVEVKTLPAVEVVSMVHKGGLDFESMGPTYQAMMKWSAEQQRPTTYSIITYYTPPDERTNAEVEIALVLA